MGRVEDALRAVPREAFLPESERERAGEDRPLPIGHGVTNSQPSTVRNMLALLDAQPGHRVLDVGCGSCWTTALLAHLVGPAGHVVGVELIPEVLAIGRANLGIVPDEKHPDPAERGAFRQGLSPVELHLAEPGVFGWPAGSPYDRILVSADAAAFPTSLVEQLAAGGVLVGPVGGEMLRVTRRPDGETAVEKHGRYSFVPLVGD